MPLAVQPTLMVVKESGLSSISVSVLPETGALDALGLTLSGSPGRF